MRAGTVSDLSRSGKLLEIGCRACSRHIFVAPVSLGLPLSLPVPEPSARLVCSRCGALSRHGIRSGQGSTPGCLV
jgi:hypothetical protein